MKKLNFLMLLALTLLMFGCRTELTENDTIQSDFRKTIKLKEALAFKNYLTEIKNNPSHFYSKNEDFFSSLPDEATVTVITQHNVTSYSTVIRHLDRSSDVLVYSVDNENKSIGFTAKYKPADLTKNYQIDNFTGTVEYTAMNSRPMGTRELVNGVPLAPKTAQQNTTASKVACSYSINLIEVNCNGDNHTPSQYAQCVASEKPYYVVEITEVCPSGGQPPKGFPNMGMYDGGGDSGGSTTSSEMSIQDSFNYMLNEAGFPELSAEEYTYIQNNQYIGGQLLSYFYNNLNQNNTQLLHWSIRYFKSLGNLGTNTITIWKEFESKLNFAQQFFANNPNATWEQFYNQFLDTPCERTKTTLNKSNIQQGISNVKAQAQKTLINPKTGEIGFKEKKDGTVVPADVTLSHQVKFNDTTDGYGGYHNHTASGIHILSPYDIVDTLFGFAAAQSVNDGVGNAYFGMIAAEWCNTCPGGKKEIHYVIRYAGTGTELGNFVYSPAQMAQFKNDYQTKESELTNTSLNGSTYINSAGDLNEKGLEKLFFDTLTNIGLDNKIVLQRVESNGTVYNVTKDNSGSITATPCP
ncbi:hypothetical protein J2786_002069 [Chryseobacterium vietnamense]|uniref:Uncharacterized protein n=1 Tax=Chryseobacterium vietnamense TaxID=866785 RepID=A0ACC6J866_9FLAO|nr:hypothetical protein [Chryseobacterium vietnamense]MDR6458962.1 hypothetical protein [Chryseobacterium vietnamense]